MRKILVSLAVLVAAGAAKSADLGYDYDSDYLRGSDYGAPPPVATIDWSGVYIGGHGGYTTAGLSQRNEFNRFINNAAGVSQAFTPQTQFWRGSHANSVTYGAFAGYNVQFDDVVVGLEVDYTHSSAKSAISGVVGTSNLLPGTAVFGRSQASVSDYGTIRARAGYAFGNVLPYVTGGIAIGNGSIQQALYMTPDAVFASDNRSKIIAGATAGAGIDYAITPNVMLRAEYQYINFQSFHGQQVQMNTIRGGAAVKF